MDEVLRFKQVKKNSKEVFKIEMLVSAVGEGCGHI